MGVVEALPEEVPHDEFPPIQPGNGRIEVRVTDRFGTPMPNAGVRLNGLVSLDLRSDDAGMVSFTELPDGRYDVVASATGFVSSLPKVVDVSGSVNQSIDIVMKRPAVMESMSTGCGMMGPLPSLEALFAGSEAVIHVKIVGQRAHRPAPDSRPGNIETVSRTRWIESFKVSSNIAPEDEIVQAGGRLDDGERIEVHTAKPHAALNVGERVRALGAAIRPVAANLLRNRGGVSHPQRTRRAARKLSVGEDMERPERCEVS